MIFIYKYKLNPYRFDLIKTNTVISLKLLNKMKNDERNDDIFNFVDIECN